VLRVLEGLMTLQVKGGARERLSYRTLDVEQIGSVYETVMGFTVETAAGRSIAIKAGKHNRTPVFVDLEQLAAAKGRERIKFLKEEAERGQLSAAKWAENARRNHVDGWWARTSDGPSIIRAAYYSLDIHSAGPGPGSGRRRR
jgi:hypothetical protein